MANKLITQFTELTTPANDDLLVIVDISDTTHGASGTTKKIQKSNLDFLSNDVLDYTDATIPLDPTNTLIVEQGGAYKKVAISEISSGASKFDFISDNVRAETLNTASTILKQYNIGKLSELSAIQFYIVQARETSVTNRTFTISIYSVSGQVFSASSTISGNNYFNLAKFFIAIDNSTNELKYPGVGGVSDLITYATYIKNAFNPLDDYTLTISVTNGGFVEQVLINLYKL